MFFKAMGCDPARVPFSTYIEDYKKGELYYVVEGYYSDSKNGIFYVTETSDSSIQINKEYKVYEYGPFGTGCEMGELKTYATKTEGKRYILLVYKDRTTQDKLVVPIFLKKGVEINGNRANFYTYEYKTEDFICYYTDLVKLKKYLFKGRNISLKWKKEPHQYQNFD